MSLSDIGMVASSLRVVSFTARFHRGGASMSASRHPNRKPSAPNISHSIIETSAPRFQRPCATNRRSSGKTQAETWHQFDAVRAKGPQPGLLSANLERIPGGLVGRFQVADIGPKPKPYARADRSQRDMAAGEESDAHPADEIGRAVHPCIGVEDLAWAAEVVDENHGLGAFRAEVVAKRGALPIHPVVAGVLGIERALAVA